AAGAVSHIESGQPGLFHQHDAPAKTVALLVPQHRAAIEMTAQRQNRLRQQESAEKAESYARNPGGGERSNLGHAANPAPSQGPIGSEEQTRTQDHDPREDSEIEKFPRRHVEKDDGGESKDAGAFV